MPDPYQSHCASTWNQTDYADIGTFVSYEKTV